MTHKPKALGLALVAVFAMTAVFASSAQALKWTAGEYPATLTGEDIGGAGHEAAHTFTFSSGGKARCQGVKFHGTIASSAENEQVKITPTYSECDATFSGKTYPATFKMTQCYYLFHDGTEFDAHLFDEALVDLKCPNAGEAPHIEVWETEAKHLALAATTCSLTPTPKDSMKSNTYTNVTPPTGKKDVELTSNVQIPVVHRTGSLICGPATQTATYSGTTTMTAWKDTGGAEGGQLDLTVSK